MSFAFPKGFMESLFFILIKKVHFASLANILSKDDSGLCHVCILATKQKNVYVWELLRSGFTI